MSEDTSSYELDIANDLLDLIPRLLQQIRGDIPTTVDTEQEIPEWHDIKELRATSGQLRLLRVLTKRQHSMQELADLLGVAAPTVTAMVKRLLTQGFVERVRDEQDWRVVWISPTERGLRAVTLYDQFRRANLQRRLAQLNQEELALLRAALPVLHHLTEVKQ
jgi:DNA-binding MarR family transcriptional regulator